MAKINDTDNIGNGEHFDINESQTLSNPKITDMNETAMDQVKPDITAEVKDDFYGDKNLSQNKGKSEFLGGLTTGLIDTVIMLLVSGVLLCITGVILLYGFGYYVTNALGVLFIILVIVSVLYPGFKGSYRARKLNKTNKI